MHGDKTNVRNDREPHALNGNNSNFMAPLRPQDGVRKREFYESAGLDPSWNRSKVNEWVRPVDWVFGRLTGVKALSLVQFWVV